MADRPVSISPVTGRTRRVAALPAGGEELEVAGDDMYAAFDAPPRALPRGATLESGGEAIRDRRDAGRACALPRGRAL